MLPESLTVNQSFSALIGTRFSPEIFEAYRKAEMKLVESVLDFETFKDENIQSLLIEYIISREDNERVQIIINLMKAFWIRKYAAPGPMKIFEVQSQFEDMLYALGKRGHFLHQFLCFLLGSYIIKAILGFKTKKTVRQFGFFNKSDIFFTWLLTSCVHDCGYPLQVVDALAEHMGKLYNSLGMKDTGCLYESVGKSTVKESEFRYLKVRVHRDNVFLKDLVAYICMLSKSTKRMSYEKKFKVFEGLWANRKHEMISALLVARCFMENEEVGKKVKTALSYALPAIAVHGFKDDQLITFGRIKFSLNPYAYLLFLVDNLQDWSRPTRVQHGKNPIIFNIDGLTFKDSSAGKKIILSYTLFCRKWNSKKISRVIKLLDIKRRLLSFLEPGRIGQKLSVRAEYRTNEGKLFRSITIPVYQ
jgi:hypothetical protein